MTSVFRNLLATLAPAAGYLAHPRLFHKTCYRVLHNNVQVHVFFCVFVCVMLWEYVTSVTLSIHQLTNHWVVWHLTSPLNFENASYIGDTSSTYLSLKLTVSQNEVNVPFILYFRSPPTNQPVCSSTGLQVCPGTRRPRIFRWPSFLAARSISGWDTGQVTRHARCRGLASNPVANSLSSRHHPQGDFETSTGAFFYGRLP
jgi:hypothetical protein